jgi:3-dehydroquinate synthase
MRLDKKTRGSTLRFVVLDDLGSPRILPVTDELRLRDAYRAVSA